MSPVSFSCIMETKSGCVVSKVFLARAGVVSNFAGIVGEEGRKYLVFGLPQALGRGECLGSVWLSGFDGVAEFPCLFSIRREMDHRILIDRKIVH